MTNNSPYRNGKSFCNCCDYGPLGFNTCSPRVDSQTERIAQQYCGYANIEGIEITNKKDSVIIHRICKDIEVPKQDLFAIKNELSESIERVKLRHDHPNASILSKLFELQEANV